MILNINTDALQQHTKRLEMLHRSALPSAVRGALNDAVFDVKTKTMLASAKTNFTERQPNFFKANSRFENATGWNIGTMKSTVGFVEGGLKGGDNYAVKDLDQQEHGGAIGHKTFIPLEPARVGKSKSKVVRANARLASIKNIVKTRLATGKNKKERFVKSAVHAGKGGFVLSDGILWRINSVKRKDGNTVFNKTALYSEKKGRSVNVKQTQFMEKASLKTANKLDLFYIKQAERQLRKFNA